MTVIEAPPDLHAIDNDCTPSLFERLSSDGQTWLAQVFPQDCTFLPVVMARQEMAGHVDLLHPPQLVTSDFRVARLGVTTFDVEGWLVGLYGRTVARSTTVFAVTDRLSARTAVIPAWLSLSLSRTGHA